MGTRTGTEFVVRCGAYGPTSIVVIGDLDASSSHAFGMVVGDAVGDRDVTIDLTRCESIDPNAVSVLLGTVRRMRAGAGRVAVRASEGVRQALSAAGAAGELQLRRPIERSLRPRHP